MFISPAVLAIGSMLTVSATDRVPSLDTRPACADAAQEISVTRTADVCERSEQEARDSLVAQWRTFPSADRTTCTAETRIGGFPSYVQVLTCLELARDARNMKSN